MNKLNRLINAYEMRNPGTYSPEDLHDETLDALRELRELRERVEEFREIKEQIAALLLLDVVEDPHDRGGES